MNARHFTDAIIRHLVSARFSAARWRHGRWRRARKNLSPCVE
jgi:hypothetical protein